MVCQGGVPADHSLLLFKGLQVVRQHAQVRRIAFVLVARVRDDDCDDGWSPALGGDSLGRFDVCVLSAMVPTCTNPLVASCLMNQLRYVITELARTNVNRQRIGGRTIMLELMIDRL